MNNFFNSSESDSSEKVKIKKKWHKIIGFVEKIVQLYTVAEFKQHFRLSRATCNFLIGKFFCNKSNIDNSIVYRRKN